jgi:hypothetical protein
MSAAILQGVPATTLDTDIWIDLPPRQYISVNRLCQELGATILANTVVELGDGSLVNFLYHVDGLKSFKEEYRHTLELRWMGLKVAVLPLDRIYKSKRFVGRPKDLAHLPLLKQVMSIRKRVTQKHKR